MLAAFGERKPGSQADSFQGPAAGQPDIVRCATLQVVDSPLTLRLYSVCGQNANPGRRWPITPYASSADFAAIMADGSATAAWTSYISGLPGASSAPRECKELLKKQRVSITTLQGSRPDGTRWSEDC